MIPQNKKALKEASPYTGVITREQFLFYEMRTTARLVEEGLTAAEIAKQICLYAMMKQYRLVWDFMVTVIGEKYHLKDLSFGKIDLNT